LAIGIVVYFPAVAPPEAKALSGDSPKDAVVRRAAPPTTFSSNARRDVEGFDTSKLAVKCKLMDKRHNAVSFMVTNFTGYDALDDCEKQHEREKVEIEIVIGAQRERES
jgi:hypothetical protein